MQRRSLAKVVAVAAVAMTWISLSADAAPPEKTVDLKQYVTVRLTSDLSGLSADQRKMISLLIKAASRMDDIFWREAYGDRDTLLAELQGWNRAMAEINYGPWDRLAEQQAIVGGRSPQTGRSEFLSPRHDQGRISRRTSRLTRRKPRR